MKFWSHVVWSSDSLSVSESVHHSVCLSLCAFWISHPHTNCLLKLYLGMFLTYVLRYIFSYLCSSLAKPLPLCQQQNRFPLVYHCLAVAIFCIYACSLDVLSVQELKSLKVSIRLYLYTYISLYLYLPVCMWIPISVCIYQPMCIYLYLCIFLKNICKNWPLFGLFVLFSFPQQIYKLKKA